MLLILIATHEKDVKIISLSIEELNIPFKHSFSHASATRNSTEAVLVKVMSQSGLTGFGEGCPRSYVTGETVDTAVTFFEQNKKNISQIESIADLKDWVNVHQVDVDENPAAWCAVELALLDLLGQEQRKSIEPLLKLPTLSGDFQYTAVLGASKLEAFRAQSQQYLQMGFTDYKIKITGDLEQDKQRICVLRELKEKIIVRLDANNFWDSAEQALQYIKALDYDFFAIEEPLRVGDYEGCISIYKDLGTPIILDESFLKAKQFDQIAKAPETWIINIRISKMGGILRSLEIAEQAKKCLIPIIVGAQVGETSILTRAALTIANSYRTILLGQEGAYGTYLLKNDVVEQPLMFEKGGRLSVAEQSKGNGFGLLCNV